MISVAKLNSADIDVSELKAAGKRLLLATFHDILPGSSVADGEK